MLMGCLISPYWFEKKEVVEWHEEKESEQVERKKLEEKRGRDNL